MAGLGATVTVTVTAAAPNTPPTANPDSASTAEDSLLTIAFAEFTRIGFDHLQWTGGPGGMFGGDGAYGESKSALDAVVSRLLVSAPYTKVAAGEPLAAFPLVSFALSLIEFSFSQRPFAEVSRLIRSPFLGGADPLFGRRFTGRLADFFDLPSLRRGHLVASVRQPRSQVLVDGGKYAINVLLQERSR